MAVTSGFFDSRNGDRKYNADQMSEYFRGIVSGGVFQHLDGGLQVTAGTGLAVNVAAGRAIVQNRWIQNSASLPLSISAASETYGRKDAVVLRLDSAARTVSISVKTGTPAASPAAPEMTRSGGVYEMALAYVNVAAGATSVTVTDKRSDSTVCGWATVAQSTSGEVDQMLDDMKTGFDGVVYNSPVAMVQGEDQKLQDQINLKIDLLKYGNIYKRSFTTSGYDNKILIFDVSKGTNILFRVKLDSTLSNPVYVKVKDDTTTYLNKTINAGSSDTYGNISFANDSNNVYCLIGCGVEASYSVEIIVTNSQTSYRIDEIGSSPFATLCINSNMCYDGGLNATTGAYGYDGISILTSGLIHVDPETKYDVSNDGYRIAFFYFDETNTYMSADWFQDNVEEFVTPSNCRFVKFGIRNSNNSSFHTSDFTGSIIIKKRENIEFSVPEGNALLDFRELDNYYKYIDYENSTSFDDNSYIDNKISSIPEGRHFIFITDTHWEFNAKKSTLLLEYVRKRMNIKKVVHGGDLINRLDTKYQALAYIKNYMQEIKSAVNGDLIVVGGNHDLNTANVLLADIDQKLIPYVEVVPATMGQVIGATYYNEDSKLESLATGNTLAELKAYWKMHYYVDDTENKIRYIVLQTGNGYQRENGVIYDVFGQANNHEELYLQINFMDEALKTTPSGYTIVLCGHMWWRNENAVPYFGIATIMRMLIARKYNMSINVWISANDADKVNGIISTGNHTYNYQDLPQIQDAFALGGHFHFDFEKAYVLRDSTLDVKDFSSLASGDKYVSVITSQCDAYGATVAESATMTDGTITEQCFDVVTITENSGLKFTRFGAGDDRSVIL